MLAQRGKDLAVRKSPRPNSTKQARPERQASAPPPVKRRLSFNEKYALENLPQEIASLETRVRMLQARLDDPELYARDRNVFDETSRALASALSELSAAEEKWLALEVLREEIEKA